METDVRQQIEILRKRCGMSLRQLAEKAGVSAGMISCIERGKTSPSISMLQKILEALGTDIRTFLGGRQSAAKGPVIPRQSMQLVRDEERSYTVIFPKKSGINVEMLDEHFSPSKDRPEFEKLNCDVAGYVISGNFVLDIKGQPKKTLRPGDAFYITKGVEHRGYAAKDTPARLISIYTPPNY